jgi:hypothetical protein
VNFREEHRKMAESSSHQQHKKHNKHNSSSSAGNGGGIAGDSKKWACMYCTYLNWEANFKCVLCNQARHRPMLIEGFLFKIYRRNKFAQIKHNKITNKVLIRFVSAFLKNAWFPLWF